MQVNKRFSGTVQTIVAHWPRFMLLYGGMVGALLLMGVSAERGWYSFVPLSTAALLLCAHFFAAALWSAHQLYDRDGVRPHLVLFNMGHLQPQDRFAVIDVGFRERPLDLSRRLTTGQIIVLDVYNPQWTTSAALARRRKQRPHLPADPRLVWREGQFNLLPLPDNSVSAVLLCQTTAQFWQHGDRLTLLREALRILTADGRLLFAEQARSQTNWLIFGPTATNIPSDTYWRSLLKEAGFFVQQERDLNGHILCLQAQIPTHLQAQQLQFELDF
ncbi:MAG: class I SAM-dependent methyltransferase [Chloroflexi bacterium]|nr:class I SAM-dependent methyltransferase [Chloroflexota bacterium]